MNDPGLPDPSPVPRLSVVIVNYDSWDDVSRLVDVLGTSPPVREGRSRILVVDNASPSPIPDALRSPPLGVSLIFREENGGFAVGVNAGWNASRGSWLLVLNPDVVADAGFIGEVLDRIERDESRPDERPPGIVGFGLRNPDGSPQPSVGRFPSLSLTLREQVIPRSRRKYQPDHRVRPGPVPWVTGACVLLHPAMLEEVGGMDEDFFLYYEEVDLCRSAANRGWRVEFDPSIHVDHLRPLQNRPISPKMRIITRHSKLLYFRKHLPHWQFRGLALIVSAEVTLRGAWARVRGDRPSTGSWRAIGQVVRRLVAGDQTLRGRKVLELAESAIADEGR